MPNQNAPTISVVTENELAETLHLSKWTVRKWRLAGGLPHIKIGRRIFYRLQAVEEWLREQESHSVATDDAPKFIAVA